MTRFKRAVPVILKHEGGFVNDFADPGGATNMGITHGTLAAWRGRPVTVHDVKTMTELEAREIYMAHYWNAVRADELPPGVDLVVFDFAVNAGVSTSAKVLQRLVYVKADGAVGPITLDAAWKIDPISLINGFSEDRMRHYRSLKTFPRFGVGWTRRTSDVRRIALEMAREAELVPVLPLPAITKPRWLQRLIDWLKP